MSIPEIDICGFLAGDEIASRAIFDQVNEALRTFGFFTITGHGVDERLISQLSSNAKAFFDLPYSEKQHSKNPGNSISRGYVGLGQENLGRTYGNSAFIDVKEQLAFGRFDVPDTPYYQQPFAAIAFEQNILPVTPGDLAENVREYYRCMESLTTSLLQIFAGVSVAYFAHANYDALIKCIPTCMSTT
jgi:isopenicillin N synthase-like dioxygenase